MMRAILALAALLWAMPVQARQPVDLLLVLAVDSSGSVEAGEFRLQMAGIAQAFRHPVVLQAIQRGEYGVIAVALFEWSSQGQQHMTVPWTAISDAEATEVLADTIENAPRFVIGGSTAVGDALLHCMTLLGSAPFRSNRHVCDISGDGSNNNGPAPDRIRDRFEARGWTVNGLVILTDEPNLREYYQTSVIGGPGAFVMVAEDYSSFANAILSKLLTEIAGVPAFPAQLAEVP